MVRRAMDLIWALSLFVSNAIMVFALDMRVFVIESSRAIWFHPCVVRSR
jgi:hypothetical protein